MAEALTDIRVKESHLTLRDLKHLFRCAATLISAPKASILFFSHRQKSLKIVFSAITI